MVQKKIARHAWAGAVQARIPTELGEAKGLMMKGKVMLSKGKPEGKDLINMAFAKGKGKDDGTKGGKPRPSKAKTRTRGRCSLSRSWVHMYMHTSHVRAYRPASGLGLADREGREQDRREEVRGAR